MFVRPLHATVRDPANPAAPLPAEGREVPRNCYWLRRLAKGDVEECEEPQAPDNAAAQPPPED